MMATARLYVSDLDDDLILLTDRESIASLVGEDEADEWGSAFVRVADGDIVAVWLCEHAVPFLHHRVYERDEAAGGWR
jgi:hypothetical protein